MWSILKIYLVVTLLAFHVYGVAIRKNELIDGIFLPVNGKMINTTHEPSYAYEAKSMIDMSDVVLKFVTNPEENNREFITYFHLGAMTNENIEDYGILRVYYYKNDFDMEIHENNATAGHLYVLSSFECDLWYRRFGLNTTFNAIDILLLLRDFVHQSKYMHSKGIVHGNIRPENVMLRKGRSFLVGFGNSTKMNIPRRYGDLVYSSNRYHVQMNHEAEFPRYPNDDWQSYLYVMAEMAGVELDFFNREKYCNWSYEAKWKEFGLQKSSDYVIKRIKRDIKTQAIRDILVEFAKNAFTNYNSFPLYDNFETKITEKINEEEGLPYFSWLSYREILEAEQDQEDNPPSEIRNIDHPIRAFPLSSDEAVDFCHFDKLKDEMAENAKANYESYIMEEAAEKETEYDESYYREEAIRAAIMEMD